VTGSQVGTVNVVGAMNEGETLIVGAEIVIGTMIETVDMIEIGTETHPAHTIQEVVGGHDLESILEIMIVIGINFSPFFLTQTLFLRHAVGPTKLSLLKHSL
jgi:hypothetical protein